MLYHDEGNPIEDIINQRQYLEKMITSLQSQIQQVSYFRINLETQKIYEFIRLLAAKRLNAHGMQTHRVKRLKKAYK